jgi:hypothetical protein
VFIALFLVKKVPLNCTSAIKSLLHASVNSLSTIVQKVSIYCIFHTGRTGLLFIVVFFSFFCSIVENSSLFDEFVCKLGLFLAGVLMAHECQKRPNLHTNELNTTFFCSTSPLKAPNRLKPLKLA